MAMVEPQLALVHPTDRKFSQCCTVGVDPIIGTVTMFIRDETCNGLISSRTSIRFSPLLSCTYFMSNYCLNYGKRSPSVKLCSTIYVYFTLLPKYPHWLPLISIGSAWKASFLSGIVQILSFPVSCVMLVMSLVHTIGKPSFICWSFACSLLDWHIWR